MVLNPEWEVQVREPERLPAWSFASGLVSSRERDPEQEKLQSTEEVLAEVDIKTAAFAGTTEAEICKELERVDRELERYTSHVDPEEYALAVGTGLMAGVIDALYVGQTVVTDGDLALSHQQVNRFIQEYAKSRGMGRDRLKDAIGELEQEFKVAQDNVWKGAGIHVSAKDHHLADLAHHPTPVGLLAAIVVQFLRVGTFVNRDGTWHFLMVETTKEDLERVVLPAVLTGLLNWLVCISEKVYEDKTGEALPKTMQCIAHLAASAPLLTRVAACADNWFGHLVSDMGGSKNTAGAGMGIPGVFLSFLYEVAALPGLKDTQLPHLVDDLYQRQKLDLRHELAAVHAAKKQWVPVLFVELCTRVLYFAAELGKEQARVEQEGGSLKAISWNKVIPFGNRSVDRMLTVASMTFNVADTADAAVHAAVESQANMVLFASKFVVRYNYVGAGRAVYAIVKEISAEKKEGDLLHQKRLLAEQQTQAVCQRLEEYQAWLEQQVTAFLVEDITAFLKGFAVIQEGVETGNSQLVIGGSGAIQEALGRKPQFASQEEFDELMGSQDALIL